MANGFSMVFILNFSKFLEGTLCVFYLFWQFFVGAMRPSQADFTIESLDTKRGSTKEIYFWHG